MRQQEGKCHYKPAPENTVEVNTTIKGVNLNEMDETSKEELKKDIQETVAEAADEEPEAVNVTLTAGSVIVTAVVDLEERIGIMEGEKEGQNVNLVEEMKAVKSAVQQDVAKDEVKNNILTKAKNNEGVKNAATGEITMTDVEATMTAEAATKSPTEAPVASTSAAPDASSDSSSDSSLLFSARASNNRLNTFILAPEPPDSEVSSISLTKTISLSSDASLLSSLLSIFAKREVICPVSIV